MARPSIGEISRALAGLALLCLAGCAQSSYNAVPMTQTAAPAAAAAPVAVRPQDLRLSAGDRVRITVAGADRLDGEYAIDLSGALALPLVGAVPAAGSTAKQLEAAIAGRLRDEKLMQHPEVTVALVEAPFYALGEVRKPGKYPYVAGLNIISAIATAGGFTPRAEQDFVFVRHAGQPDEAKVPIASALAVAPGDIIRVGIRVF